jgi:2,4'-dihydroxyacetophenone dioxygenase
MAEADPAVQAEETIMSYAPFDDSAIRWQPFGDLPHFVFAIQHVDMTQRIADVLFKFAAGQQIVLHRHKALNHTFVVSGEHRLYEMDGRLREVRPTGSYTVSPASETPHREGGGDQDVVVLFSMRPRPGEILYEVLGDDGQVIGEITLETLDEIQRATQQAGSVETVAERV